MESGTGIMAHTDHKETFLSRRSVLWAPDMGNLHELVDKSGSSSTLDLVQVKLVDIRVSNDGSRHPQDTMGFIGSVNIPFELLLPAITGRRTQDPESVPPSLELGVNGNIEYSLAVVIHFGKFLNKTERDRWCCRLARGVITFVLKV
jgi:hypothetical protein